MAFYRVEKKLGLLGTDGKLILDPTYDVIKPFIKGYAKVRNNDMWGMINKKGDVFIKLEYNEIGDYSTNGVWAKKGDTFGIISNNEFHGNSEINKIANGLFFLIFSNQNFTCLLFSVTWRVKDSG